MRLVIFFFAVAVFSASCSSTKRTTTSATSPAATASKESSTSDQAVADGSSFEKAIVILKKNTMEGIAEEYKWLKENYPGYTFISQSLTHKGNKSYDILTIQTKDGEKKSVYFDITGFFGKF